MTFSSVYCAPDTPDFDYMSAAADQKKEIASLKRELKKKPKKEVIVKEKEVDLDLEPPKSIKDLEKKLSKRLNKDGN